MPSSVRCSDLEIPDEQTEARRRSPAPQAVANPAAQYPDGARLDGDAAERNRCARRAWVDITADPRSVAKPQRQHRLKADLKSVKLGDEEFEQWQYEVTAGGRIWYAIDDATRTLWVTKADMGHPSITDKGEGGGRRIR
ncbi:hypothetical protein [Nocardia sp. NPDC059228]|uniref:hypothetical protein n=1 Tax=Nocardia sp. NPDC059228 TaxID=3346777 RepID=UPI003688519A